MLWVLFFIATAPGQVGLVGPVDVSRLHVGAATTVAEIDTGKLKGDVRQLAWSPDAATLYLQTADGNPPAETLHHYTVALNGGAITQTDRAPDWAVEYWIHKQDRVAPGRPSLVIEIEQKDETAKGVRPAGALDRQGDPTNSAGTLSGGDLSGNQKAHVVRLSLLGEEIAVWVNERVIPGMRFGWAPIGTGALVYAGEGGRLVLFDQNKHRQVVPGVKDAVLPAWSDDGERLAFLQRTARRKYLLLWLPITQ